MANSVTIGRAQLVFVLCLPLAVLLGYLLSDPLDPGNTLLVGLMVGVLSIPLLMHGHHALLIFTWNAAITPTFLPGQPYLWVPLAFLGLGFAVVNRFISPEARFISVQAITKPLLLLLTVVLATAFLHGGFGLRSFGSETYGGRNYVYIFAAIAGYFALSSRGVPKNKARFYVALFFLTGLTALVPNLAYFGGRPWYFLYYIFPPVYAMEQAMGETSIDIQIARVFGLTVCSLALLCWLLARYGLRGIFNSRRPWPLFLFLAALAGCLFCGFRSMFLIFFVVLAAQFWLEGLFQWKIVVPGLAVSVLIGAILLPNAEKLPLVVQRTISVLPARLSPVAEFSAEGSTEWRLEMWKELLPQIPKYLLKGKGFGIDPAELSFAQLSSRTGVGYAGSMAAGDYHSGPLSLIIPLGIWGVIGFGWFVIAALKYLYRQHKHGDPGLQTINTFLLAYFIARLFIFTIVAGGFFSDLFLFTGIAGLSVSLNGAALPPPVEADVETQPAELTYQEHLVSQRAQ